MMRPVGETHPISWLFTFTFFFIGALGIMNLVTAVFIEELLKQTQLAAKRKEARKAGAKRDKRALCCDAIRDFDINNDGSVLSPSCCLI